MAPGKVKKVFIAEDIPNIARIYGHVFRKSGYEVEMVSDGEQAIEALFSAKSRPDIILLDIMMPKATGFEVLLRLKKRDSALREIPVLAMTNLVSLPGGEADLEKIKALGAADVIIKSQMDPQEVVSKVAGMIAHN